MKVRPVENSEKLGVASLQLQEQIKNVQQEDSLPRGQVVDLKLQLLVAKEQKEIFCARIEANNRLIELECHLLPMPLHFESTQTDSDFV